MVRENVYLSVSTNFFVNDREVWTGDVYSIQGKRFTVEYSNKLSAFVLKSNNIKVIKPLGYLDFLKLMWRSTKVVTDSGGVQKEAFFMGKPCITLRETTEWIETVKLGWNILVGAHKKKIISAIKNFKPKGVPVVSTYGDGQASRRIAEIVGRWFEKRKQ